MSHVFTSIISLFGFHDKHVLLNWNNCQLEICKYWILCTCSTSAFIQPQEVPIIVDKRNEGRFRCDITWIQMKQYRKKSRWCNKEKVTVTRRLPARVRDISKELRSLWELVIYLNNLGAIQVGPREHPSTIQVHHRPTWGILVQVTFSCSS